MIAVDEQELLDVERTAASVFRDLASSEDVHRTIEVASGRDAALESQLRDVGFYTVLLPGEGATLAHLMRVVREAGASCATTRLLGHAAGVGTALARSRPSGPRDALIRDVSSGEVGTVLGVAPQSGAFRYRKDEHGLVLDGTETFAVDADGADFFIVFADGAHGALVAVVRGADVASSPLATIDRTRILSAVEVVGLRVAEDQILASGDEAHELRAVVSTVLSLALSHDSVGIARRALQLTVDYAKTREQFGRAIGSFQAVKHQAADMAVRTELARSICDGALRDLLAAGPQVASSVAMARDLATRHASWVAGRAVQLHGGIGYSWEHDAHILLKRAKLNEKLGISPAERRSAVLAGLRAGRAGTPARSLPPTTGGTA